MIRNFLLTAIVTTLLGLAWRNREVVLGTSSASDVSSATTTKPSPDTAGADRATGEAS